MPEVLHTLLRPPQIFFSLKGGHSRHLFANRGECRSRLWVMVEFFRTDIPRVVYPWEALRTCMEYQNPMALSGFEYISRNIRGFRQYTENKFPDWCVPSREGPGKQILRSL